VCTSSTIQYLISQVPPVLILHFKRFQTQRVGFRKVLKHVSFPILLDLAPICKGKDKKPRVYALYGVVEHSGTTHGGHYVAYVKVDYVCIIKFRTVELKCSYIIYNGIFKT
jgi:ubiquitin carboxyl-terminal hydrolase 16/45